MAKFKCPEGVSSVSVGGEQFNADDEGFIEAHDNLAGLLEPHGFTREKEPKPPQAGAEELRQKSGFEPPVRSPAPLDTQQEEQKQSRRKAATAPQAGAEQAQE
ncbi:hypothetical protein VI26_06580 [Chromobacterium sp. LK1]|uniref:hypothetical protein n=1 Tax=Chromobacterium sp. LK1 TaxID=1628193 RepID=UPI0006541FA4|nr:hypothetical protein [Chromobacterium sp. LK1]KMN36501.1 hypothetical protein VI26_06580 [Chromobacterium sp. LK1]